MFRAVSLLSLAFLTVAAVALTSTSQKKPPQVPEPDTATEVPARGTALEVVAVKAQRGPLYYAAFSLN